MYVYIYVYIYMYVYKYVCIYKYVCMYISIFLSFHVCMYVSGAEMGQVLLVPGTTNNSVNVI